MWIYYPFQCLLTKLHTRTFDQHRMNSVYNLNRYRFGYKQRKGWLFRLCNAICLLCFLKISFVIFQTQTSLVSSGQEATSSVLFILTQATLSVFPQFPLLSAGFEQFLYCQDFLSPLCFPIRKNRSSFQF